MKKKYTDPDMEIVLLDEADIIITSLPGGEVGGDGFAGEDEGSIEGYGY